LQETLRSPFVLLEGRSLLLVSVSKLLESIESFVISMKAI
jgi:hypothetical protein